MNKSKGRVEIAMICIIIGIMIVMQTKSINNLGGLVTTQRADQMLIELNQMKRENDRLQNNVITLENDISFFENEASSNNAVVEKMLRDVDAAKDQAGFTDLEGPGIIITLDYKDSDGYDPFQANSVLLLFLVNELNAAGAEAISINGERIINSSEIRLAGSHININGKKNSYPYTFNVIGNTSTLKSAVNMRDGILDIMESNYINVEVEESEKITVFKYNGTINFKYAKPIK
ncbi:DUF881 domain-containing protein [Alkalibaculum sp. M08DMB]|uniref:DUF881 domain-containing protein n=1 Tax=Alkalibaculum sporogenes TaxID=2655001 RepID=A0A6A7K6Z2_9FIRM|nr:DUF881 domain-containing protein [Alkalibaculum sporogenes]MPW25184.1 DUF881 domain-containing protein [Alkalibaculum sporogenes]